MQKYDVKKYLIEKTVLLIFSIWIIYIIPFFCSMYEGRLQIIAFQSLVVFFLVVNCWRLLVFPIDVLIRTKHKTVYFSRVEGYHQCVFYLEKFFFDWKFYYGKSEKLKVLVPVIEPLDVLKMNIPKQNQKMIIEYYPFSKIICGVELI